MKHERRFPFLWFVVCLVAAMPVTWGEGALPTVDLARPPNPEVTLCHIPPGDPASARTIVVGESWGAFAVRAHLAHGDYLGECQSACDGVPSAVPKTGLTGCWDVNGAAIDCAGTGQDGEYQKGVSVDPRFTDNLDGTVKDNLTGLVWLKDALCFGYQHWTDALASSNILASGSCGLTDGSIAGTWRLPNVKELTSLIDYGQSSPALPPGHPFNEPSAFVFNFWSSTTPACCPLYAWFVNFQDGFAVLDSKTGSAVVWPVRGGQ